MSRYNPLSVTPIPFPAALKFGGHLLVSQANQSRGQISDYFKLGMFEIFSKIFKKSRFALFYEHHCITYGSTQCVF